jgi:hypothetical protein
MMIYRYSFCLFVCTVSCAAQTVIGSARVACGDGHEYNFQDGAPIVGAIINQSKTTITDLEVEMSIVTRDKRGNLKRQRDTQFSVVPSLNQTGIVASLAPNSNIYFSVPGSKGWEDRPDRTCPFAEDKGDEILNVAVIAITRINGKSLLLGSKGGKPPKRRYKVNCVNGHRRDQTKETRWQSTSNSSTSYWRTTRSQKTS